MFHNIKGYDARLFIKELGKKFNKDDIGVIEKNEEKYISFNVEISVKLEGVSNKERKEIRKNIRPRFIDSCRFMVSDFNKLAPNLDDDQCKHRKEFYNGEKVFKLVRQKRVYLYEYIDDWEKFQETRPPLKNTF